MMICPSISELHQWLGSLPPDQRIGLVPTMGNLHEGHISLCKLAQAHCDVVVVSIFVNPTQFGPGEDFERYPRTFEADCDKLLDAGVDGVFAPSAEEMYPNGQTQLTSIHVPGLSEVMCGASRPGHFDGVCTVVNKLFNLVQPDVAVFGSKDFQQLAVIRKMVADLDIPVEIIGAPIVREASGLAMSSRNGYLSADEKAQAAQLYQLLNALKTDIVDKGRRDYSQLQQEYLKQVAEAGFEPDYLDIREAETLATARPSDKKLVLAIAAKLGKTRLIDNINFTLRD